MDGVQDDFQVQAGPFPPAQVVSSTQIYIGQERKIIIYRVAYPVEIILKPLLDELAYLVDFSWIRKVHGFHQFRLIQGHIFDDDLGRGFNISHILGQSDVLRYASW